MECCLPLTTTCFRNGREGVCLPIRPFSFTPPLPHQFLFLPCGLSPFLCFRGPWSLLFYFPVSVSDSDYAMGYAALVPVPAPGSAALVPVPGATDFMGR